MKPLNKDEPGCTYTTSNCVIWQGPDIECIKLCKGDTVSDVVFKLAQELCEIMETLDISTYDLSCFNLTTCKPDDFEQLIQFLIGRICKLEKCTGCIPDCDGNSTPTPDIDNPSGCPDCMVNIASCFFYTNQLGDTVTSMQLKDYVTAIGNLLCSKAGSISTLQATVTDQGARILALEREPLPSYYGPKVVPACVINPGVSTDMDVVLQALENQFCDLRAATGIPNQLFSGIQLQPAGMNSEKALNGSGNTMGSLPGWSNIVNNVGQSLGNLWIALQDARQAIRTIQINCCPTGCDGIELSLTSAIVSNHIVLYITGTIPAGFAQCFPTGTVFTVTDSFGASISFPVDLIGFLNNPSGYSYDLTTTPINPSADMHIKAEPCLTNPTTNATCKSCLEYDLVNSASCPDITFNITQTSITYNFNSTLGTKTYSVELWNAPNSTMLSNQIQVISIAQPVTGSFTSLTPGVNYNIRLTITVDGVSKSCPFYPLTTNPPTCITPTDVVATIISAPEFGPARTFGVLAGAGITNAGVSSTDGDVGTYPTTTETGFGTFTITGTNHNGDTVTQNAKNALVNTYNDVAGRTPVVTVPTELGGTTKTPGNYDSLAGTFQITGTLTLDAGGDLNAVFIFDSASTLITAAGSLINLINGAQAKNVFFAVGSSATLGTTTSFKGNIIAVTSITVNNGATIVGRVLAKNGAVTLDTNIITLP